MKIVKILPCPFCGDPNCCLDYSLDHVWVKCTCGAIGPWSKESVEAIQKWNVRYTAKVVKIMEEKA